MELLQLKYFYESAKQGSFAKTAERYGVPATSVSASVKRLEKELGCRLFDREYNRILLNADGKRLQQSLGIAFEALDSAVEALTTMRGESREIKLLVRAIRSDMTDYIIEYKGKHPQITFKTVYDFGETEYEKYDIIIDEKTDKYEGYETFELYTMRIRMKAAADSPLCRKKHSLRQLSGQSFISWGEQSNMHTLLCRACSQAGFIPNIVVQSNDTACYEKLIASGIGIGPGRENFKEDAAKGLAYLDIADFDERYTVYAYYKQQAYTGSVKHFIDFLHKRCR
ncbi:MAG: LysR family transcriptional regulator [Clostridia bacterium]|nr:LysR family transcriptional regulator [Clostridia bacterium]